MAGEVSLGGELSVNRLGFGAMRLYGRRHLGPTKGSDGSGSGSAPRRRTRRQFSSTLRISYGPYVSEELIARLCFPTRVGW